MIIKTIHTGLYGKTVCDRLNCFFEYFRLKTFLNPAAATPARNADYVKRHSTAETAPDNEVLVLTHDVIAYCAQTSDWKSELNECVDGFYLKELGYELCRTANRLMKSFEQLDGIPGFRGYDAFALEEMNCAGLFLIHGYSGTSYRHNSLIEDFRGGKHDPIRTEAKSQIAEIEKNVLKKLYDETKEILRRFVGLIDDVDCEYTSEIGKRGSMTEEESAELTARFNLKILKIENEEKIEIEKIREKWKIELEKLSCENLETN